MKYRHREFTSIAAVTVKRVLSGAARTCSAAVLVAGSVQVAWSVPQALEGVGNFTRIAQGGYRETVDGNYPLLEPDIGSGHNSYTWSMEMYQDKNDPESNPYLYGGTVRDVQCAAGNDGPLTGPCEFSSGALIPFGPDQRAELWRYMPSAYTDFGGANGHWERVYQSPYTPFADAFLAGIAGTFLGVDLDTVPRDVGYRNLVACQTDGDTGGERLYATTSGVPGNVLVYNDDTNELEVTSTNGLKAEFSDLIPADLQFGGINIGALLGATGQADLGYRGLACFNGYLITSPASSVDSDSEDVSENPFLLGNSNPANGSAWEVLVDFRNFPSIDYNRDYDTVDGSDCTDCGLGLAGKEPTGDLANYGAFDMIVLGDDLWVAVSNRGKDDPDDFGTPSDRGGVELWRGDGRNFNKGLDTGIVWNKVIDVGAGRREDTTGPAVDNALGTFGVLDGKLYMAMWESGFEAGTVAELIRIDPGTEPGDETWELLVGGGRLDYATDPVLNGSGNVTGTMVCQPENRYQDNYAPDSPPVANTVPGDGHDCYPSTGRNAGFGPPMAVGGIQFADNDTDGNPVPDLENEGGNWYFWRFVTHKNAVTGLDELYMGTLTGDSYAGGFGGDTTITPNIESGGFELHKTSIAQAGNEWTTLTTRGFRNPFNYGIRSFKSTPLPGAPANQPVLFVGTANPHTNVPEVPGTEDYWGGTEVFMGTFDFDDGSVCTGAPTPGCLAGNPVAVLRTDPAAVQGSLLVHDIDTACPAGSTIWVDGNCWDTINFIPYGPPLSTYPGPGDGLEPITLNGADSYDVQGGTIVTYEWFDYHDACSALAGPVGAGPVLGPIDLAAGLPGSSGDHAYMLRVTDNQGNTSCDEVTITVSNDLPPSAEISTPGIVTAGEFFDPAGVHLVDFDDNGTETLTISGLCEDPAVPGDPAGYELDACAWSAAGSGASFADDNVDFSENGTPATTATLPVTGEIEFFGIFTVPDPSQIILTAEDNPNDFTGADTLYVYVHPFDNDTSVNDSPQCQSGTFMVNENQALAINPVDLAQRLCGDPDTDDTTLTYEIRPFPSPVLGTAMATTVPNQIIYTSTGGTGTDSFDFRASDGELTSSWVTINVVVNEDETPPSVDIQGEPDIVNSVAAFSVTFEFSENVTGFTLGDISVGNGSAGNFQTTDANTYTADITPSGAGAVTIDVAGGVAQDSAGNFNTAASQAVVAYDATAPTVDIQGEPDIVNSITAFSVTFEFSENVTGFALGDITVGNGSAGNFQATDANTYTADITPSGTGTITIDVASAVAQDGAGNPNTAATQAVVAYDATAPGVDIQNEPTSVINTNPFSVTFEFSENVTGFVLGDIAVGNGSAGTFQSTDANTYTANITPDGTGDVTIDVAGGVAQDAAGNFNIAAAQALVVFDDPPVFTSPDYFAFSNNVAEVGQVTATDDEDDPITFSLVGGDDQALFEITSGGLLGFLAPPSIDLPADQDGDNQYQITIQAFDGSNTTEQAVTVGTDEVPCIFYVVPVDNNGSGLIPGASIFCL